MVGYVTSVEEDMLYCMSGKQVSSSCMKDGHAVSLYELSKMSVLDTYSLCCRNVPSPEK